MGNAPDFWQSGGAGKFPAGDRRSLQEFSNRELDLLETIVSYSKQRRACRSNREL
jgi:hypothetical protein